MGFLEEQLRFQAGGQRLVGLGQRLLDGLGGGFPGLVDLPLQGWKDYRAVRPFGQLAIHLGKRFLQRGDLRRGKLPERLRHGLLIRLLELEGECGSLIAVSFEEKAVA